MSTMSLRLPESSHQRARELAKREGTSINQLIATALACEPTVIRREVSLVFVGVRRFQPRHSATRQRQRQGPGWTRRHAVRGRVRCRLLPSS